jgi:hypothetical protein
MRHIPWRELGLVVGFIALLLVLYVGAYYALVEATVAGVGSSLLHGETIRVANYRIFGHAAGGFFGPAHEFDRKFFPARWQPSR